MHACMLAGWQPRCAALVGPCRSSGTSFTLNFKCPKAWLHRQPLGLGPDRERMVGSPLAHSPAQVQQSKTRKPRGKSQPPGPWPANPWTHSFNSPCPCAPGTPPGTPPCAAAAGESAGAPPALTAQRSNARKAAGPAAKLGREAKQGQQEQGQHALWETPPNAAAGQPSLYSIYFLSQLQLAGLPGLIPSWMPSFIGLTMMHTLTDCRCPMPNPQLPILHTVRMMFLACFPPPSACRNPNHPK